VEAKCEFAACIVQHLPSWSSYRRSLCWASFSSSFCFSPSEAEDGDTRAMGLYASWLPAGKTLPMTD
jgi:hypothetical protein